MRVVEPDPRSSVPDLSLVVPCYNEEKVVAYSVRRLLMAFAREGYRLELVAVDNGSTDRTGEILRDLASRDPAVIVRRVEHNRGYGYGVLQGLSACTAQWVGHIPADGQVDAEDVVRLYEAALITGERVVAKVRRRFRMDGASRRLVTLVYNSLVRLLWPGLPTFDVNAVPKLLPRELLAQLRLESWGWALDPEIMIKAYYLDIPVLEYNIMARQRGGGSSHVRLATAIELFVSLLRLRFSKQLRQWRRQLARPASLENNFAGTG